MHSPRIAFMGTSIYAVDVLEQLLHASILPLYVFTQPPRPRGRGMHMQETPVATFAQKVGLMIETPTNLDDPKTLSLIESLNLDVAVVVSYGQKLPETLLDIPKLGCINLHPSLLPRWRGAAPLERAIEAGDNIGGITIIRMDTGIDTGPILAQKELTIGAHTTSGDWHKTTAIAGAELLVEVLGKLKNMVALPQETAGITYAKMFHKNDLMIDFNRSAQDIINHIRAFSPKPGAWCLWQEKRLRLLSAKILKQDRQGFKESGTIVSDQMAIQTGTEIIQPTVLQLEGRKALSLEAFLRGHSIPQGTVLQGKYT